MLKPILKEYEDAETGVTQGISMEQMRSLKIAEHKKDIWRITTAQMVILLLTMIVVNSEITSIATDFIQSKYDEKKNSTDPVNLSMDIYKTFIGLADLDEIADSDDDRFETLFEAENATAYHLPEPVPYGNSTINGSLNMTAPAPLNKTIPMPATV